jgi:hypothetical protein
MIRRIPNRIHQEFRIQEEFRADDDDLKNSLQRFKIQQEVIADHDPKISTTEVRNPSRSFRADDYLKNS